MKTRKKWKIVSLCHQGSQYFFSHRWNFTT